MSFNSKRSTSELYKTGLIIRRNSPFKDLIIDILSKRNENPEGLFIKGLSFKSVHCYQPIKVIKKKNSRGNCLRNSAEYRQNKEIYPIDTQIALNKAWVKYIFSLDNNNKDPSAQTLLSIFKNPETSLIGARCQVIQCHTASSTGIEGTLVQNSPSSYKLATNQGKVKIIPVKETHLLLSIPSTPKMVFWINGKTPYPYILN